MTKPTPSTAGAYRIIKPLGSGSQGTTYLAEGPGGVEVALKELRFERMDGWKALELFERETQTLRTLDHPAIPKFVDAFTHDEHHYLAQEFIDGEALSEVALPLDEDLAERCARDILHVLEYLHDLVPPIVHRDIKPANIIRRQDGSHVLVDFGGVQLVLPDDVGGSTVIGTTGYMPAEQLAGRATPQSDLYGLGATLVHLLTAQHPSDLPTSRMKLQWDSTHTRHLRSLLDALLEPVPDDRPRSASDARALIVWGALAAVAPQVLATTERADLASPPPKDVAALVARRLGDRIHRANETLVIQVKTDSSNVGLGAIAMLALITVLMLVAMANSLFAGALALILTAFILNLQLSARHESTSITLTQDGRAAVEWRKSKHPRETRDGRLLPGMVLCERHTGARVSIEHDLTSDQLVALQALVDGLASERAPKLWEAVSDARSATTSWAQTSPKEGANGGLVPATALPAELERRISRSRHQLVIRVGIPKQEESRVTLVAMVVLGTAFLAALFSSIVVALIGATGLTAAAVLIFFLGGQGDVLRVAKDGTAVFEHSDGLDSDHHVHRGVLRLDDDEILVVTKEEVTSTARRMQPEHRRLLIAEIDRFLKE